MHSVHELIDFIIIYLLVLLTNDDLLLLPMHNVQQLK